MFRRVILPVLMLAGLAAGALVLAMPGKAAAQDAGKAIQLAQVDPLANFFRGLFGGRPTRRERQQEPRAPRQVEPAQPKVVVQPKDENARVVYLFGDSIAASLARGLEEAFAEDPTVIAAGISDGSSGLVRDDYLSWPEKIAETLDDKSQRIDVAVIAVGINDRQRFRIDGTRVEFRSPEWEKLYAKRVREVMQLFFNRRIPVVWVGLPPVSTSRMSTDFLYLNEFYRDGVEDFGGFFVDVWTNFLDENERYSSYGPDVAGQRRLLRRKDGINFTRAGGRKLAFFVERQIKRVIGGSGLSSIPGLSTSRTGPDPRETGIGYVFELTGPLAAGNGELAGGPEEKPFKKDEKSAYQKVLVEGASLPVVGGAAIDPEPAEADKQARIEANAEAAGSQ